MAYNSIHAIKSQRHLKEAAEYAANPKKTTHRIMEREAEKELLDTLTGYATNEDKTQMDERLLVTGINCFPETAAEKMIATKRKYGKMDKRQAYHLIQSFAPGEITPELAHEIGVKYAEAWLGDFEVVIGTHLDRGHIHNHLIVNSVSFVDGSKFHMSNSEFYTKLYGISNDLCRQYGLSVIENIDSRQMTYEEWLRRYGRGGRSLGEIIHADVESCAARANSLGELYTALENMGYEVDVTGKHPKVRPLERDRFFRLSTLGFTDDVLKALINGRERPAEKPRTGKVYRGRGMRSRKGHKLTRLEAMYIRWMFVLGKIKAPGQRPVRRVPASEYQKFDRYRKQLKFLAENRMDGLRDVARQRVAVRGQIARLDEEKYRLRGALRGNRALFEAHRNYMRYAPIANKLDGVHRERFEQAKEVLRDKGYGDRLEVVAQKRVELLEAIARNKKDLVLLRGQLRMLEGIMESCGHIRGEEQKHKEREETEEWKEKRQGAYSREWRSR